MALADTCVVKRAILRGLLKRLELLKAFSNNEKHVKVRQIVDWMIFNHENKIKVMNNTGFLRNIKQISHALESLVDSMGYNVSFNVLLLPFLKRGAGF